jgi:APA family basic amino acid/polyamine antiporter
VISGQVAADFAGPAVILSFILTAIGCGFTGLCYAEYACLYPISGSAYSYALATFGPLAGWFVGWNLVLEYLASASVVAVGWSGYFASLLAHFGIAIPGKFKSAPFTMSTIEDFSLTGSYFDLPAVIIVLLSTLVLVVGIRLSARTNTLMVGIKLAIILLLVICGLPFIDWNNLKPFIPENTGEWGHFGTSGVLRATGVIFFAYLGFDTATTAAQEARNPQRDMPVGIIGALAIATVFYVMAAVTMLGLVSYSKLGVPNPMSVAIGAAGPGLAWLGPIVDLAATVGLASTILVTLLGQTRIFFAMAKDGLVPNVFGELHSKFRTPAIGTIITGVISALLAAIFPLEILGELCSIGTLMAFIVVCAGIMVLRLRIPDAPRAFRTPFVWLVAPLGIVTSALMMLFLPADTWLRLAVWTALGMLIYVSYRARRGAVVSSRML